MSPALVTFDCYGTLVDWRRGIRTAFLEHVPGFAAVEEDDLFRVFAEIENDIEAEAYRPYREVLRESARGVAARFRCELPPSGDGFLADSLPGWEPFPDVKPALERLRSLGYPLGILSNVDDDLLAGTLRHIPVPFEVLVTAERVRSYKPAPAHFERALEAVDGDPRRLLHVAQSHYHDVRGAVPLGIPVVWVNRHGDVLPEGGPRPTAEVRSVAEAVAWLGSDGGSSSRRSGPD